MEIWEKIQDARQNLFVSNYGRIKSMSFKKERFVGSKDINGYLRINYYSLSLDKNIDKKIHRIVSQYFLPNYSDNLTVNHMDFDKTNNHVDNLELISVGDNVMHYITNKIKSKSSSKKLGVGFHVQLQKWTARVTINRKRISVGTYNTEAEAIDAIEKYHRGENKIKQGKGKSNIGKSKYSDDYIKKVIAISNVYGKQKASKICGLSYNGKSLTYLRKWATSEKFKNYFISGCLDKKAIIYDNMEDCFESALKVIESRSGKMVNGQFKKDE